MNRILFLILICSFPFFTEAQGQDPVKWLFTSKKITPNTYEVHITATIENGWRIYSQSTPDGGPVPTTITFSKNPLLGFSGEVKEIGKLEQHHEPLFEVDVKRYSNKVEFVQLVELKGKAQTSVKGSVEFMACNNKQCLPPKTVEFMVSIK